MKLNEITRMQQLAGMNEIEVKTPGNRYQIFDTEGYENGEFYHPNSAEVGYAFYNAEFRGNQSECIDFIMKYMIKNRWIQINNGAMIDLGSLGNGAGEQVTSNIKDTENWIWHTLTNYGLGGDIIAVPVGDLKYKLNPFT
jgi:hypothetical protein